MVFPTVVQLHKARFGCLLSLTAPSCPHPALGFWVWKQDAVCGEEQGGSPCAGRLWNPPSCKSVLRMVQEKQQKHQHPLQCPALCSEHPVAVSPSVTLGTGGAVPAPTAPCPLQTLTTRCLLGWSTFCLCPGSCNVTELFVTLCKTEHRNEGNF